LGLGEWDMSLPCGLNGQSEDGIRQNYREERRRRFMGHRP